MPTIWQRMLEDEIARAKALGEPRLQQHCRAERSVSDRAYAGYRCEKHPMLFGVRYKKDGMCVDCRVEKRQENRKRPEVKAKRAKKARERRNAIEANMRALKVDAEAKAIVYDRDPGAWVKYVTPEVRRYFGGGVMLNAKQLDVLARPPEDVVHSRDGTDDATESHAPGPEQPGR